MSVAPLPEWSGVESAYVELLPLLINVGVSKFWLSEEDAVEVAQEVFVDYLTKVDRVTSDRAFLVAAMCNASRYHQRVASRTTPLGNHDPGHETLLDQTSDSLEAGQALGCLTPRCQFALHLRYYEGYTVPEIATEFRTSVKYAEKVVRECLRQAQRRVAGRDV